MARSSEKCENCGAPLPITTKARYRDIRGEVPQQLLPGSEWRQILMSSVAHQNDCVWIRMSLFVGLCLHVYICVQVQPMRMGDSGPSHGPYSLPTSQNETTLKTWMLTVWRQVFLTACSLLFFLSFPSLGRTSRSIVNWGEMGRAGEKMNCVPIPILTFWAWVRPELGEGRI